MVDSKPVDLRTFLLEEWRLLLGMPQLEETDDLSGLGADSLKKVAMFAKLEDKGFNIDVASYMGCNSIAEVADIEFTRDECADKGRETPRTASTGSALTSSQQWFMSEDFPDPGVFSLCIVYECKAPIDESALNAAVGRLIDRHQALTSKYVKDDKGVVHVERQNGAVVENHVSAYDLSDLSVDAAEQRYGELTALENSKIDLAAGCLFRLSRYAMPQALQDRLVLIVHHMAADFYSLNVLRDQLWEEYERCRNHKNPMNDAASATLGDVIDGLNALRDTEQFKTDYDYWVSAVHEQVPHYPRSKPLTRKNNAGGESKTEIVKMPIHGITSNKIASTDSLDISIRDSLLIALHLSLVRWTGDQRTMILLVDSARHCLMAKLGLNVSRTVGWLSWSPPVVLEHGDGAIDGGTIDTLKRQITENIDKGYAYEVGYLMGGREDKRLHIDDDDKIVLNYLGDISTSVPSEKDAGVFLSNDIETTAPSYSPRNDRATLLGFDAFVSSGELTVCCNYNPHVHSRETIGAITENMRELLSRCLERQHVC